MNKHQEKALFFRLSPAVRVFYLCGLGLGYAAALLLYPFLAPVSGPRPFFTATYFGCIAVSILASLFVILLRPGLIHALLLFLRCYMLALLGYSVGGYLSVKIILFLGLMVELGLLLSPPLNLLMSMLATAALISAQAWPLVFGANALVDAMPSPRLDELIAMAFIMLFCASALSLMGAASRRYKESQDNLRLQEANLATMAELNENLQGYARMVDEESSERERNRISREIHDISGYIFTNLIALMDAAGSMRPDENAGISDLIATARSQAQEGLRETRAALRKLRQERPEYLDSTQTIFKIVSIFRKIAGIHVELNMGNLPHHLAEDLNLALYRTVQEGLTNAIRHGKASEVRVSFWVENGDVLLSIADNGRGAGEVVKGIGLAGMEERIGALGGRVSAGPGSEGGFRLDIRVPLKLATLPS